MWTREELKTRAKSVLKQNYWKLVLVGFIASIATGTGGSSSSSESTESVPSDFVNELLVMLPLIIGIATVIILVAIAVSVFVLHPLEVGTKRFFVKSLTEAPEMKEVVFAYENSYLNVVKIMFMKNLKVFLWSLLFIIPGIIKAYEYRMIPYLLAENPNMSMEEAFELSKQMMHEQKGAAFILDWSFFGWELLSAFTAGIVGIFYVQPYVCLTDAALYDTLSAAHGHPARATQQFQNTYTYTGYEEI